LMATLDRKAASLRVTDEDSRFRQRKREKNWSPAPLE
jgi:hypothetical protein